MDWLLDVPELLVGGSFLPYLPPVHISKHPVQQLSRASLLLLGLWAALFGPGWSSPLVGPGALGDIWVQHASDRVPRATANIMLSTQPLFAALFGGIFLGE
eukprot:TRINITY_DN14705_c0_g1_i2.p1 TRINITY_DN14705_c0_g1~~TRINITY_DN14705_c0_g1_i2.p1  ORF type:complete len:101 (-),score=15.70 TRINITY_DN14705_c0_g1_i2:227-529(-)